jgi:hypothetical protein
MDIGSLLRSGVDARSGQWAVNFANEQAGTSTPVSVDRSGDTS